jgi:small-conductance mechanosensitive channel
MPLPHLFSTLAATAPVPPPGDRVERIFNIIRNLWHAELFTAGDAPVHLNQLIIAFLVAVIGILVARRLTLAAQRRLMQFTTIDRNAAAAIQKIIFYLLIGIVIMIALPIAGIPITIFAVMGGAIAIGVGFGAQNLFSNLIAGLMIMTEKPIRLGDIVEVGDMVGRIDDIGSRSTRIRRFDGIDVLIPNSHFIENPVVNWTLTDADLRGTVSVGVAYGSDTRKVSELLRRAAEEQEDVLKDKDILVHFMDFADNALTFELLFWTSLSRPTGLRQLRSNIRFRIDELFREADISIAFPQRDVHLDTLRPLKISLVDERQ